MMDLGSGVCRPSSPDCLLCPLGSVCAARSAGLQGELPVRPAKKARPVRYGVAYVGRLPAGAVLAERRGRGGLYGGMLGFPGTAWTEEAPVASPPFGSGWREAGMVSHALTHFLLQLTVMTADVSAAPPGLVPLEPGELAALPTLFAKAAALAERA